MIAQGTLKLGQVIRYDGGLWRVDSVNPSRAFITPLTKQHVVFGDREFDRQGRGVSIGANSYVEVVEDVERARTELELAAAEREVAAAKAELEAEAKAAAEPAAKTAAPTATPTKRAETRPDSAKAARPGAGWHLGPAPAGPQAAGTTKAFVLAFLAAHPGASTKEVAAGCVGQTAGAVAACLDRFRRVGAVVKK